MEVKGVAGHSKWHNIKHKKAKVDAKRGKVFTKLSKEITVSAKHGGGDPSFNIGLRLLLDKAKDANMPKENIERAIKKGTGHLEGVNYEEVTYEGHGPENIAIIIQTLTDNRNRTISDLRHFFNKHGGRMGENGAVSWMFDHRGAIEFEPAGKREDEILEDLLETDIIDLNFDEELSAVTCELNKLDQVRAFVETKGYTVKSADPAWIAKTPLELQDQAKESVLDFLDKLEELEDVNNLFVNLG